MAKIETDYELLIGDMSFSGIAVIDYDYEPPDPETGHMIEQYNVNDITLATPKGPIDVPVPEGFEQTVSNLRETEEEEVAERLYDAKPGYWGHQC